jgi:hypothetical protein
MQRPQHGSPHLKPTLLLLPLLRLLHAGCCFCWQEAVQPAHGCCCPAARCSGSCALQLLYYTAHAVRHLLQDIVVPAKQERHAEQHVPLLPQLDGPQAINTLQHRHVLPAELLSFCLLNPTLRLPASLGWPHICLLPRWLRLPRRLLLLPHLPGRLLLRLTSSWLLLQLPPGADSGQYWPPPPRVLEWVRVA